MYLFVCVSVCVSPLCVGVCACMYVCVCLCTHACMCVQVCKCVQECACVRGCVGVCMCGCGCGCAQDEDRGRESLCACSCSQFAYMHAIAFIRCPSFSRMFAREKYLKRESLCVCSVLCLPMFTIRTPRFHTPVRYPHTHACIPCTC